MKKVLISVIVVATLGATSFAGVAKVSYKYAVKPAAKSAYHVVKPVAKATVFPVRHPKKDVHGVKKAGHVAAKILY